MKIRNELERYSCDQFLKKNFNQKIFFNVLLTGRLFWDILYIVELVSISASQNMYIFEICQ